MADKILISPFFSRSVDDYFVRELEDAVGNGVPRPPLFNSASYKNITSAESSFKKCDAKFPCLAKTGRDLGFRWVVTGYVDASAEGDYLLQIELLNAETSRVEGKKEIVIEKDTQSLVVAAETLTQQLFDSLPLSAAAPPPVIHQPPSLRGDEVKSDGALGGGSQPNEGEYPGWMANLGSPKTLMWGSLGIAVVAGVGGVVMGVLSSNKEADREKLVSQLEKDGEITRTPETKFVDRRSKEINGPRLNDLEEQSQSLATYANYAYVGTGLSLASAGLFFYLEYGRSKEPATGAVSLFSHPADGVVGIGFGF